MPDKIQDFIDSIKKTYYNEDIDFVGDGKSDPIFVRSYKLWTLNDLKYIAKVDPTVIQFLGQASHHQRFDVLDQLMPDYYRNMGRNEGMKAFRADIECAGKCIKPESKTTGGKTGAIINGKSDQDMLADLDARMHPAVSGGNTSTVIDANINAALAKLKAPTQEAVRVA